MVFDGCGASEEAGAAVSELVETGAGETDEASVVWGMSLWGGDEASVVRGVSSWVVVGCNAGGGDESCIV